MAEQQVILKHIREAVGVIPLHELEIEIGLNFALGKKEFDRLESKLSRGKWDEVSEEVTRDTFIGSIRVSHSGSATTAITKSRNQMTDVGVLRVKTSHEKPVPVPEEGQVQLVREKHRRTRTFWGWKLCTTIVNPSSNAQYEVELELDWKFLVRRPYELLATVGAQIMHDVVSMVTLQKPV